MTTVKLTMNEETNLSHLFKQAQDTDLVFDAPNGRVLMWEPSRPSAAIHVLEFTFHKGDWEVTPYTLHQSDVGQVYEELICKHLMNMKAKIEGLESQVSVLNRLVLKSEKPTPPDDLPL